ncbi:hypothetical protein A9Z40_01840 [Microbacterium arborescens]|uniref:GntR family transcriptional regulator n=1 Tax=Microbacterium arborescens TaxID=33883 RepID=A0ABX2WJ19_9MICO|nr:hypothetical protein A9Z40_01840 [Microbacterium arborescens]
MRYLMSVPSATTPEVIEATGLSKATTRSAVREIEELGYLTIERGRGTRPDRISMARESMRSDLEMLLRYAAAR